METKRLILRRAMLRDIDAFYRIRHSEFVLKYNAMTPWSYNRTMKQLCEDSECDNVFYLELKDSGELIGMAALEEDSLRYGIKALCLSYYLGEEYVRNGYMSEAIKAVIAHAFLEKDMQLISARVFSANTPSLSLLKKLGFVQEGCLRQCVKAYGDIVYDDAVFSMLKEEFEAQPWAKEFLA